MSLSEKVERELAFFARTDHPQSFELLTGRGRVLFSAPHAVLQTRMSAYLLVDFESLIWRLSPWAGIFLSLCAKNREKGWFCRGTIIAAAYVQRAKSSFGGTWTLP